MTKMKKDSRIDKWLWAARFYKTRELAVKAVKNGQVLINGKRVKPASSIHIDDLLIVKKGVHETEVKILEQSNQRGPASIAQTLYEETQDSIAKREKLKQQFAAQPKVINEKGKPDKRGVRDSLRFKRGE